MLNDKAYFDSLVSPWPGVPPVCPPISWIGAKIGPGVSPS